MIKWLKKRRIARLKREIERFNALQREVEKTNNGGLLKRMSQQIPHDEWRWTNCNFLGDYAYTITLPDGYELYASDKENNKAAAKIIQSYIKRLEELAQKGGRNEGSD